MLNCTGCANLKQASADGYCSEFSSMPQISGQCDFHSERVAARAAARATGTYIHIKDVNHADATSSPVSPK